MRELGIDRVHRLIADLSPDLILANRDEATTLDIDGPVVGAITIVKRGPDPAVVYSPNGPSVEVAGNRRGRRRRHHRRR